MARLMTDSPVHAAVGLDRRAVGEQAVERAVDDVAVGHHLEPGADRRVGLELRCDSRPATRPAPAPAARPAANRRVHDAPEAARMRVCAEASHLCHPGAARRRLLPLREHRVRHCSQARSATRRIAFACSCSLRCVASRACASRCARAGAGRCFWRTTGACALGPRHVPATATPPPALARRGSAASLCTIGLDEIEQRRGLLFQVHVIEPQLRTQACGQIRQRYVAVQVGHDQHQRPPVTTRRHARVFRHGRRHRRGHQHQRCLRARPGQRGGGLAAVRRALRIAPASLCPPH